MFTKNTVFKAISPQLPNTDKSVPNEKRAADLVNESDTFLNVHDKEKATMALHAVWDYHALYAPLWDDEVRYVLGIKYLIRETGKAHYMTDLGAYYAGKGRYDLAYKYRKMAAELGYQDAILALGNMWYYGQYVERDYKKAFAIFDNISRMCLEGMLTTDARIMMAKMFRDGKGVPADMDRYRRLIKRLYYAFHHRENNSVLTILTPELAYLLAEFETGEGNIEQAVSLLKIAKRSWIEKMRQRQPSRSDLALMEKVITMLYTLEEFDPLHFDFYDLFFRMKKPCRVSFSFRDSHYRIKASDDWEWGISFEGRCYRSFGELCRKAEIDGWKMMQICRDFTDWKLEEVFYDSDSVLL